MPDASPTALRFVGPLRRPATWWIGLAAWYGTLFILSSMASTDGPSVEIPHLDKAVHFTYFAAGGFAFGMAMILGASNARWSRGGRLLAASALVFLVLGAIDEYHQTWTPGRSGNDPGDLAADVLGAVAGTALARRLAGARAGGILAGRAADPAA